MRSLGSSPTRAASPGSTRQTPGWLTSSPSRRRSPVRSAGPAARSRLAPGSKGSRPAPTRSCSVTTEGRPAPGLRSAAAGAARPPRDRRRRAAGAANRPLPGRLPAAAGRAPRAGPRQCLPGPRPRASIPRPPPDARTIGGEVLLGPTAMMVGASPIRPWRLAIRHRRAALGELRHALGQGAFVREARAWSRDWTSILRRPSGVRAQAMRRDGTSSTTSSSTEPSGRSTSATPSPRLPLPWRLPA